MLDHTVQAAALLQRGDLRCDACGRPFDVCCFWSLTARVLVTPDGLRRLLCCVACGRREGHWRVGDGLIKSSREEYAARTRTLIRQ